MQLIHIFPAVETVETVYKMSFSSKAAEILIESNFQATDHEPDDASCQSDTSSSFILWLNINPEMDLRLQILFVCHAAGLHNNLCNKKRRNPPAWDLIRHKSSSSRYWNIIGLLSDRKTTEEDKDTMKSLQRENKVTSILKGDNHLLGKLILEIRFSLK